MKLPFKKSLRAENEKADALSELASSATMDLNRTIHFKKLESPTIEREVVMEINQSPCWMDPIKAFLESGKLPYDQIEAQRIERNTAKFILHEGKLLW